MGYPVAYRGPARMHYPGGFQRPRGVSPKGWPNPAKQPWREPPPPANDNWPIPDNDNIPGRSPPEVPPLPETPAFPGFPEEIAEEALKRVLPPALVLGAGIALTAYDWYVNFQDPPTVDWEGTGWWVVCGPATPDPAYTGPYKWHKIDGGNWCGLGLQALGDGEDTFDQNGPPYRTLAKYLPHPWDRWQIITSLRSVIDPPLYLPVHNPAPKYVPRNPWLDPPVVTWPELGSVGAPMPVGNYPPAVAPMPATSPPRGPAPRPNDRPRPRPGRPFEPGNSIETKPRPQPGTIPQVIIDPPTVSNPVRRPPGRGEKERKVRATGALGPLNAMLSAAAGVYEDVKFYNDVIDAWYNALPKNKGAKTPQAKLEELYRRWNDVDVNKAVWGTLEAVANEKIGGYIERARNTAAGNLGLNLNITIPTGSAPYVR